MVLALYSLSVYEEIVAHTNLKLMTKLTDYTSPGQISFTSKEQDEAMRIAWISNTEVKLIERKNKPASPVWDNNKKL